MEIAARCDSAPPDKQMRPGFWTETHLNVQRAQDSKPDPFKATDNALNMAPHRLRGALVAALHGLLEIRNRPTDATALCDDVAGIWRRRLGPNERAWLMMTAIQAAEPGHVEALAEHMAADVCRDDPFADSAKQRLVDAWDELDQTDRAGFLRMAGAA